jgi:ketopantoate hydroxymethyltransferase/glycosyl hydrolase family 20
VPVILPPLRRCYLDVPYAEPPADPAQAERQGRLGLRLYAPMTVAESFDWEPADALGSGRAAQVAGVEAAIWAETIADFDDLSFLLPRLAGVAHRAWSASQVGTWTDHRERLALHGRLWAQDDLPTSAPPPWTGSSPAGARRSARPGGGTRVPPAIRLIDRKVAIVGRASIGVWSFSWSFPLPQHDRSGTHYSPGTPAGRLEAIGRTTMTIGTAHGARSLYERRDGQRVTVDDIQQAKQHGERFVMLTAYDTLVAGVFDRVGVPLLLVGDTSGQVVFGYANTLPVTMDHLVPLVQAAVRGTSHALVVGDLPFGAYQESPEAALAAAVRHLKEGGAQAVKLEGGRPVVPQVAAMVAAGIRSWATSA